MAATDSQVAGRRARLPEQALHRICAPPEDASAGASSRCLPCHGEAGLMKFRWGKVTTLQPP